MQVIIIIVSLLQIFFIKTGTGFTCQPSHASCTPYVAPDYYWRDFVGYVPGDAVPGGLTADGNITYIGQAYIKDRELLPVTIYRGCSNARSSAYGAELQPDKNIKVLCSNDISKFSWVPTTADTTPLIYKNCKLPLGGSELNELLSIGRVTNFGELIIGKVFSYPSGYKGLWIPNETGGVKTLLTYEILLYNCIKKT